MWCVGDRCLAYAACISKLCSSLDFAANFLDVAYAGALSDVAFEMVGVRLHGYATVVALRARVCLNPSKNQEEPH